MNDTICVGRPDSTECHHPRAAHDDEKECPWTGASLGLCWDCYKETPSTIGAMFHRYTPATLTMAGYLENPDAQ